MNRITELVGQISRADSVYHNGIESGLTDHEYDKLVDELKSLTPAHPILKKVGAKVTILTKVKHKTHMGSQFKATNEQEFKKWAEGLDGVFPPMIANLKLDGFSLALYYENGLLQQAITRGDGFEGEDITANAIRFKGVPIKLAEAFTGAVRGEGVMTMADWATIDPNKESNPRNLAAGIARRKDGTDAERITFYAFDIEPTTKNDTEDYKLIRMRAMGFSSPHWKLCRTLQEAIAFFTGIVEIRPKLQTWIDGVIFKVNSLDLQEMLGVVDNRPKGQIAWKFEVEEASTVLKDCVWTVGHTGKLVPTAVLKPVQIEGTTVSNALLCNPDEIERLGLAIGDKVVVAKMGGIIPKILRRATDPLRPITKAIPIPAACPVCGGQVGKKTNTDGSETADIYCLNDECGAKAVGKVKRWVKSLDIQGLGGEIIEALATQTYQKLDGPSDSYVAVTGEPRPYVSTVCDLYRLNAFATFRMGLFQINGRSLGKKRADSILAEIDKTRKLSIDALLGSLGVKHLGKRRVTLIREAWSKSAIAAGQPEGANTLDEIENWFTKTDDHSWLITNADKIGIPGIAVEIQKDVDSKRPLIEDLLKHITIIAPEKANPISPSATQGPLSGQVLCFTGCRPDDMLKAKITSAGGQIAEDLTKTCTHLVQKDPSKESSKTKKAKGWGMTVIGLDQLSKMLEAA